MGKTKKKNAWRAWRAAGALAAAFFLQAPTAQADPAAKFYLPAVVQGEAELELRGGYQTWRNHDDDRERQVIVDVGYGFTSWWKSELAVGVTRLPGTSTRLDEIEWENIFALTEPGQYWADLGLFAELARDHAEGRNVVAIGPMFHEEFGRLQANANLLFERQLGAHAEPGAEVDYAWQLKWRGDPRFEPGVQGFGTIGRTNDFARETQHEIGPAFFSQAVLGARNKIKFDAAILFGLNRNTPDTTFRFNLEYEIY
ncbi:MAG TPA: hypothetical protein VGK75_00140 [Casimicrobiaceae bacterium]|jgi:hypothetical protein